MTSKQVYRIAYPNGKTYVGLDLTGDPMYLGSPSAAKAIAADLGLTALPRKPLKHNVEISRRGRTTTFRITNPRVTLRKTILWASDSATDAEAREMESRMIRDTNSNNPARGYNKVPKWPGAT